MVSESRSFRLDPLDEELLGEWSVSSGKYMVAGVPCLHETMNWPLAENNPLEWVVQRAITVSCRDEVIDRSKACLSFLIQQIVFFDVFPQRVNLPPGDAVELAEGNVV